MLDDKLFCFLSSSKRNLFDDTNAISMPEKKAENKSVTIINKKVFNFSMFNPLFAVAYYTFGKY